MHFSEVRLEVDVTAHIVVSVWRMVYKFDVSLIFFIFFAFIGRVTNNEERKFAQRLFE